MKKLVLSTLFTVGFCVYGFATDKIEIQTQIPQKEVPQEEPKKKVVRYDYSLFKFVKPITRKTKLDSTKISEELLRRKASGEATTYHQEKPLTFFMFSYAS